MAVIRAYKRNSTLMDLAELVDQISRLGVAGSNLSSPVVDRSAYINEIHYKVGNRLYIENAD
jgi:hypothetical protein